MIPLFDRYVGIDYSGRDMPHRATAAIQVYVATHQNPPERQQRLDRRANWSRQSLYEWLLGILVEPTPTIVGIDHAFSFPVECLHDHGIGDWDEFLAHFCERWPTDREEVVAIMRRNELMGNNEMLRLTDQRATTARSVFDFGERGGLQSQVATSTHAGIPWLNRLRAKLGNRIHFWPFDGFHPCPGRSVVAEVYPRLFRAGYPHPDSLTNDQYDAWMTCSWLRDNDLGGQLGRYLDPPLTQGERDTVRIEGWMLALLQQR